MGQCAGVYVSGIPVSPLDVCTDISSSEIVLSTMYSCSGDVANMMQYSGVGCSGDPISTTDVTSFGQTAVCSGDTCDYGVARQYVNGTTEGTCGDDYSELASFVG